MVEEKLGRKARKKEQVAFEAKRLSKRYIRVQTSAGGMVRDQADPELHHLLYGDKLIDRLNYYEDLILTMTGNPVKDYTNTKGGWRNG